MNSDEIIRTHDKEAAEYDRQADRYQWYGPEALFGICFEFTKPRERLLDMGIGTGLGSILFARAGLDVYGIDGSREMLRVCEEKNFAKDLKHADFHTPPLPYADQFFNHVISSGVFHFFGDLNSVFEEIVRIIKPGGIFTFTVIIRLMEPNSGSSAAGNEDHSPWVQNNSIGIFIHSEKYIDNLLSARNFIRLKELKFIGTSGREKDDLLYKAYAARKRSF